MKSLKLTLAAVAAVVGIGAGVATANANQSRTLVNNASSVFGASTPNIDTAQKGIVWDCTQELESPCYYTRNPQTGLYTVPSTDRGEFIFL